MLYLASNICSFMNYCVGIYDINAFNLSYNENSL